MAIVEYASIGEKPISVQVDHMGKKGLKDFNVDHRRVEG